LAGSTLLAPKNLAVSQPTYARQRDNIKLAIKLYESDDLPLRQGHAWFLNGKLSGNRLPAERPDGSAVWVEVCFASLYIIRFSLHDV
jgi:hypothetical protein